MTNHRYANSAESRATVGAHISIRDQDRYHVEGYRTAGDERALLSIGNTTAELSIHGTAAQLEALARDLLAAVATIFPSSEPF